MTPRNKGHSRQHSSASGISIPSIDGKFYLCSDCFGLVLQILNEGSYLTFKPIFHKALKLF